MGTGTYPAARRLDGWMSGCTSTTSSACSLLRTDADPAVLRACRGWRSAPRAPRRRAGQRDIITAASTWHGATSVLEPMCRLYDSPGCAASRVLPVRGSAPTITLTGSYRFDASGERQRLRVANGKAYEMLSNSTAR